MNDRTVVVTGAAGFIGSAMVRELRRRWSDLRIVSLDALTYAGNRANLAELDDDDAHVFVRADITDRDAVRAVFAEYEPDGIIHLAAESHVDRSIVEPLAFVRTNVEGTALLLQAAREHEVRRFLHVSTDEVFGALGPDDDAFRETTPYSPRSPYSASKAASDHLVRAFHDTYGLPVAITNCTNNYGPRQFPEKLIPVVITRCLEGRPVPIYGKGENVRDWLYVDDHADAIATVYAAGPEADGRTYCVGGETERSNIELVRALLDEVDRQQGREAGESQALITFVEDRPGHDFRYAMDISRIREELGWKPSMTLRTGLERTVAWYLANGAWLESVKSGAYREFEAAWYAGRA